MSDEKNDPRTKTWLEYRAWLYDRWNHSLGSLSHLFDLAKDYGARYGDCRSALEDTRKELGRAIREVEEYERRWHLSESDLSAAGNRIAKLEAELRTRGEEFQALIERHNSKAQGVSLLCAEAEQADRERAKAEAEVANLKAERQEWILVRDVLQASLDRKLACIQGLSSELEQMRQTRKAASKLHWAKETEQYQKGYKDGYDKCRSEEDSEARAKICSYADGRSVGYKHGFVDATDNLKSRVRSNVERLFEEEK